jgi:glycosyltransferase involved in cell wall biosynthesis
MDGKRRVLHLLNFIPSHERTMDRFILLMVERLNQSNVHSFFIFPAEPSSVMKELLQKVGADYKVCVFPLNSASASNLARELKDYHIDLMQTMFMSPYNLSLFIFKWKIGASKWIFVDRSSGSAPRGAGANIRKQLYRRIRGFLAGLVIDKVIAVSGYVAARDQFEMFLPGEKISTIYNGIDLARFFVAEVLVVNDLFTVVFAGQLIPEKGLDLLIEAIAYLKTREGITIRLKVAGTGGSFRELVECADRLVPGQVQFLGQVSDLQEHFRTADVAVFPSRWAEAFGFVVAEAMACGLPVITSDAGALPEVVGADQQAGLIFESENVEALARQLKRLFYDSQCREEMGRVARRRTEAMFSLDRMVDDYVSVCLELLPGSKS